MAKCNFCEAEIVFIQTPKGRQMPCEARKVEVWRMAKGKKTAVTDNGETFRCETEYVPFVYSEYAYIPHFADCPGAAQARRRT